MGASLSFQTSEGFPAFAGGVGAHSGNPVADCWLTYLPKPQLPYL